MKTQIFSTFSSYLSLEIQMLRNRKLISQTNPILSILFKHYKLLQIINGGIVSANSHFILFHRKLQQKTCFFKSLFERKMLLLVYGK